MTAAELARAVHSRLLGMPIVLASGYADLRPVVEMDAIWLAKPYMQDHLAVTIGKLFSQ